jgi:hypothetical protein
MKVTPADTRVGLRLSSDLLDSARQALGLPEDAMRSEIVRVALATVAGLDVDQHARLPMGGDVRTMYGHREAVAA